ncbi:MAG: hypothetical protein ACYSW3_30570 [Planctomycetota bacterium]|jgi:hypothetical protein
MADETETAEQTQSQDATGAAEKEAQGAESQEQKEDYEAKYKAQQAEYQKAIEERDEARNTLDTVYPAIDFDKLQGGQQQEEAEKPPVTQEDLVATKQEINNKLLTLDFRQKHPELRDYEGSLVGPAIARIRMQNPRMALDKVLDKAAEETEAFLEKEREKGRAEAEKKKADAAAAGGLGAAGSKSEKKAEDEGESAEDYVARRKKESAKARGLIS